MRPMGEQRGLGVWGHRSTFLCFLRTGPHIPIDFRAGARYHAPRVMTRRPPQAHGAGVETTFRVRYAETDGQGIVYSSHYLVWFEIGRTEWCRRAGIDYRGLEAQGFLLVVAEAHCRYLSPARYDDEVTVRCWLPLAQRRRLEFRYEVRLPAEGRRLAVGETVHVWVNREGRPIMLPEPLHRMFQSGPAASAE